MLQIDQLLKEIEEDSKINKNDLEYEIIRCHSLLAKYLRYHQEYKFAINRGETIYNELIVSKQKYYNGQAEPGVYRHDPFDITIKNAAELLRFIEGDSEVCTRRELIDNAEEMRNVCSNMIEALKFRPNHLNAILLQRRFESGA